jgi:O-antigen/teichoic acid export membrane protein
MEKKQSETSKSIFRNVIYGFSTWVLPLGLSFFATPVIVKSLGDQDYGIYVLVMGFVGYSFNFSFGRAITKYIAEFRASGEQDKIPDLISSAFFINFIVGIFSVSAICFLAGWLVSYVLEIDAESQSKSVIALYIASAIIFVSMFNQIFNSILQGIQRFDVYSKIFNLNNLTLLAGNLFLAISGYKLISLFVWNLSVICVSCVVFAVYAKKLVPEFKLNFKFVPETLKLILKYSSGVIALQIAGNFLLLFERGWITRQLGVENLTYYVVPMTLAIYIHSFVSSLILFIFPLASELKNEKEKLLRLYTKTTKVVLLIVSFCGTTLVVESRFFLTLWMGNEFAEKTWLLLVIHTITFSLLAVLAVSWQMVDGLGYPNYNFKLFMICFIINVCLIFWLTPAMGNVGIALGRLAGFGAIFFSVFYIEKWFFDKIQVRFWLQAVGVLTVSSVLAGLAERFIIQTFSLDWWTFIGATACGGIIYCLTVWSLGFISEDEKLLLKRVLVRS